jgi:aspartyl/glutamyl-tRNA(Asn/Gln) amidotransferase C subunit
MMADQLLDREQVDYIAKLAKLDLEPAERKALQKELESIFDYMTILDQVSVEG